MISFVNDYSEGAHSEVLELLLKSNLEQNNGYGLDVHSDRAKEYIKKHLNKENVDIHFISGGTQTNLLVIASFLRPHQCVIAADTGHINVHETGAIEATGHKVLAMPCEYGKLTRQVIEKALKEHSDEHMVQPKMVYVSDSTELGTIYTKSELIEIHEVCKENNLILFLDGARLASALTCDSNDLTLEDIAKLVDVFYIGGTKNGALFGEALIICKDELKEDFRYLIKQRGALLAKGFVLGIQFEALFQPREVMGQVEQEVLFFQNGRNANLRAQELAKALAAAGYEFFAPVYSNQLFPILTKREINELSNQFGFLTQFEIDENDTVIRLVTSWATTKENVEEFIKVLPKR